MGGGVEEEDRPLPKAEMFPDRALWVRVEAVPSRLLRSRSSHHKHHHVMVGPSTQAEPNLANICGLVRRVGSTTTSVR